MLIRWLSVALVVLSLGCMRARPAESLPRSQARAAVLAAGVGLKYAFEACRANVTRLLTDGRVSDSVALLDECSQSADGAERAMAFALGHLDAAARWDDDGANAVACAAGYLLIAYGVTAPSVAIEQTKAAAVQDGESQAQWLQHACR